MLPSRRSVHQQVADAIKANTVTSSSSTVHTQGGEDKVGAGGGGGQVCGMILVVFSY